MQPLRSAHLTTLTLTVGYADMLQIGTSPIGRRRIAPVTGGSFEGDRLTGEVLPGGADWVVNRADGAMVIDVRLPLKTHDGALIYLSYSGVFKAPPEVMGRFNRGEPLTDAEFTLRTVARLETGAQAYYWLNDLIVVGVAQRTPTGPIYTLHEIL